MLNLGGEKMAKSTGHVIDLGEALDTFPPLAVRLFYLRAHYRSPLEYSESLLRDAASSYERLEAFLRRAGGAGDAVPDAETMRLFEEAMDEDFNTATALAVVFDAVRIGNRALDAGADAGGIAAAVAAILEVFGLTPVAGDVSDLLVPLNRLAAEVGLAVAEDPNDLIDALISARIAARGRKDWTLADLVRNGLSEIGIIVEDTADGARWHRA
jgi:cysteinyl-tRNA synthetase